MNVWLRWDPTNEDVTVEDEHGNELPLEAVLQREGAFYLIGPLEIADPA